jgi:transcription-repair coupling factor (superfamily II helicase)
MSTFAPAISIRFMELNTIYTQHPNYQEIKSILDSDTNSYLKFNGLTGSSLSLLGGTLAINSNKIHLFVLPEKEDAAYFANDLLTLASESNVFIFPSAYKRPGQSNITDHSGMIQRTELLNLLNQSNNTNSLLIVSYPEALSEKVISKKRLIQNTLQLHQGEKIDLNFLKETLKTYQFERADFVYEPGQYSVRGSIVDVFSFAAKFPYRIDFFGDEVESIRSFDIENQLSIDKLDKIQIVPDVKKFGLNEARISLLDYLPANTVVWFSDLTFTIDRIQTMHLSPWHRNEDKYAEGEGQLTPDLVHTDEFVSSLDKLMVIECGNRNYLNSTSVFQFNTSPQPVFNKNFELLVQNLHENNSKEYTNYICSESQKQFARLKEIFSSINKDVDFEPLSVGLHAGFVDHDLKKCLYTDHQIFERYHKYRFKENYTKSEALTISEINDLHPGDYVVHIDHGIGKFGGIEKVEINGRWQEVIKLVYRDGDVLYVGIHSLHRISKFKSKDGEPPKIYKLGTGAWQKLKATTKSKVKDIAKELIALYAKRKESPGFRFSPDTYMQQELEASFIYEDTPDQEKATKLVKQGMENEFPMDMLVCGDVGFGKTEVAIRAAFKAVTDGKQVAVLVPTTILAMQHYKTFSDRLKEFPCTVDYISRMRKPKDLKETLQKVEEAKVDILIGTHRLLGKDIKFKDLGLLIIDEEQKFGVAMKEKLKRIKLNVDTLTLTATPIPRTLQFSLMGARDLAIINTPPPNRHPIITELHTFNEDIIREGIMYEVGRGGQVFVINNRIQNIYELEKTINQIVPEVKTIVAHGQMEGEILEQIMLDFINGDIDVLIATTIIESGLDIPNANTIFINEAHHFGLSDLHQLRGRVGRSNKKAFCYLLAPPMSVQTQEARRRLKAIEDFSDLGSGFNIAMQDLDIRGAGNLLGGEQSGFIAEIGYETYQRILNEAINELKENEFRDMFYTGETSETTAEKPKTNILESKTFLSDCQIDTDLEIMIPEYYVENISERIKLYREIDNIQDEEGLKQFETKLIDRFGPVPSPTEDLMNIVRLRWMAIKLGFERISIKNNRITVYFVTNQLSPYYQSVAFNNILTFIQKNPRIFQMKEGKDKLTMHSEGIRDVKMALELLNRIL